MTQSLSAHKRHLEPICTCQNLIHPSTTMIRKYLALPIPRRQLHVVYRSHADVMFGFVNVSANNGCFFQTPCNYRCANRITILTTDGFKLEDDSIDLCDSGRHKRFPRRKEISQLFNAKEDVARICPIEYYALLAGSSVTPYSLNHRYKDRDYDSQERADRRNSAPIQRAKSFPRCQNDSETDSNCSYPKRLRPIGFAHPRFPFIFPSASYSRRIEEAA